MKTRILTVAALALMAIPFTASTSEAASVSVNIGGRGPVVGPVVRPVPVPRPIVVPGPGPVVRPGPFVPGPIVRPVPTIGVNVPGFHLRVW